VPIAEAIAYFERKGMPDKVRLLRYRQKSHLVLYQLQEHQDYHHGYMVPSTGFLGYFALTAMGEGFVLRYTRRHSPTQLLPMPAYPKLLETFRQYGAWLSRLGIESVGALNDAITAGRTREVILVSEALQEQQIADIAQQVVERAKQSRIVLIAGPSSSGKTTFSKRLTIQLLAQGLSNADIAQRLYLSEGTVRNYTSAIFAKLNVSDRTQAVVVALRYGLVEFN